MTSTTADRPTRVSTARVGLWERVTEIWRYRELLVAFSRTELKVKYKNSVLGFAWSMLNPALYLAVYWVVFDLILGTGIPNFPIFLLSGILVWNLFATSLSSATGSVVANAGLVRKVAFPREILPLASVGAALVHFFLQLTVLVLALAGLRHPVGWAEMPLLPLALADLILMAAGFALLFSVANVYLRDMAHFVELALMAWFWVTPIVYPFKQLVGALHGHAAIALLNPVAPIVLAFQRALYGEFGKPPTIDPHLTLLWYFRNLMIVAVGAGLLTAVALRVFARLEGNLAEEL
jgi:ABC-2 type transport system permease protein